MFKCKIVIIDSGIDCEHPHLKGLELKGEGLVDGKWIKGAIQDDIGHGTAVTSILAKESPNAELYILKLFSESNMPTAQELIDALSKCLTEIKPDVIHLSSGITSFESYDDIKTVVDQLSEQKVLMIAAFDNEGKMSLPAVLDNVIGVDYSLECTQKLEFIRLENNKVDFLAIGKAQRLPWINGEFRNIRGASFAAPYITSQVEKVLTRTGERDLDKVKQLLGKLAMKIKRYPSSEANVEMPDIKKAIVFPFNKEIHSLARFNRQLSFEIIDYFDDKRFGNIGKNICDMIGAPGNDQSIKNYEKIDWEQTSFDTIILGHLDEMESLTKTEYQKFFVERAIEFKKNIISFDSIKSVYLKNNKQIQTYTPQFASENLEQCRGKLYELDTAVLGVYGTSSRQGKFSLQLMLRKLLIEKGYTIGQLGTEPSSILFGLDEVFPVGYNSTVDLKNEEIIIATNQLLRKIEKDKNPDILLFGMQSNTVPFNTGNVGFYNYFVPLIQLGALPDAVILCVNTFDDYSYIRQTIRFVESYTECKIIALVVSPSSQYLQTKKFYLENFKNEKSEQIRAKNRLKESMNLPTFLLEQESDMNELVICIEEFFQ